MDNCQTKWLLHLVEGKKKLLAKIGFVAKENVITKDS